MSGLLSVRNIMHHLLTWRCLFIKIFMRILLQVLLSFASLQLGAQTSSSIPCSDPKYREFDFWIGDWDVFGPKGKKAGESKISLILDSCIILEEWTGTFKPGTFGYKGKSFNTYNSQEKQWQQTWVDNSTGSTHYIFGRFENNKMEFKTAPFKPSKDTTAILRLSFFKLDADKVRQLGEQSKDNGITWSTQYDLEYRRRK